MTPSRYLMGFMKTHFHGKLEEAGMKATMLPDQPDVKSPAGADIRFLIEGEMGTMIHCTLETGRYRDYIVYEGDSMTGEPDTRHFWHEVERCQYEVFPEPAPGPDQGPRRAHPLGRLGVPSRSLP